MLDCDLYIDKRLKSVKRTNDALEIELEKGFQKIVPVSENIVRVLYSYKPFSSDADKPCIVDLPVSPDWDHSEDEKKVYVDLPKLKVIIDKETNSFSYLDASGNVLLKERDKRSKELNEVPVYSLTKDEAVKETVKTADGTKEVIKEAVKVQTGTAYQTRLHFEFDKDEALYGLGQHEEGYASLRGKCIYLNQANRTIAIPFFVSTKGYGLFVNTCSPSIFNDGCEGSYFYTEADNEMDFFFINGESLKGAISGFRKITGKAVMLPKWAFGYIQSQERYESQDEILSVADEYRKRGIGLDCIVLDWISWPDNEWGQKSFDKGRFPYPKRMTDELHSKNVHFMISIWPNMAECTDNYREFKEADLLLPKINIYDALNKDARDLYWKQASKGLFANGIDAWWCDNSEPICPEWMETVRPENSKNYERYCEMVSKHLPAQYMNAFGLFHAMGIYEGQRGETDKKRVVNLTRSGYPGQQRFGTILWSGDISASWDTLKRQIAAGLSFCASGMPYWTVDIGAFFVKDGLQWYWNGDFNDTKDDPEYCELFTRWYQWGAFLPIFRGHGTDVRRELWTFDHKAAPFYDALVAANKLRYKLMPYIYSLAGSVHLDDGSIISPLSFGFTDDKNTWEIFDQYMFGDALMICPVTDPMYFGTKKTSATVKKVYLPGGTCWYDLYTGKKYEGGCWTDADAPLDKIPVFVKAGSIVPMTKEALSVAELSKDMEIHVYPGEDGAFSLYDDAGDGYAYEQGEYTLTQYHWDDKTRKLYVNGVEYTGNAVIH